MQEVASVQNCPLGNGGETASLSGTCGEENTFYEMVCMHREGYVVHHFTSLMYQSPIANQELLFFALPFVDVHLCRTLAVACCRFVS